MKIASRILPVLIVLGVALAMRSQADGEAEGIVLCRHRGADGRGARPIDLAAIERNYRSIASEAARGFREFEVQVAKKPGLRRRTGLRSCEANEKRTVRLSETVPPEHRKRTLYFVHARRGGGRPSILPDRFPEGAEVFVLDADSAEDVALLSQTIRRRVTLASAEFAKAVGVRCADGRVTFSADGRSARVEERVP